MITRLVTLLTATLVLTTSLTGNVAADSIEYDPFASTWDRTDRPVQFGAVARTWMWGPYADRPIIKEPYSEAPGGERIVKYYDKARMEITDPNADPDSIWHVTNGLLVVELITGRIQVGDDSFEQGLPATVNVAGDADDPDGPTYATFNALLDAPAGEMGGIVIDRVDRQGSVGADPALAAQNVARGHVDEVTRHAIAAPFWDFMNSSGTVFEDGQYVTRPLFENAYFATGRPITEPYWAEVKVGGQQRDVLMQCFERRCLTYTPGNPPGFVVEAGNVGQHYYSWRYDTDNSNAGGDEPTPHPSPTPTPAPSPTPTATPAPSPTPTATPSATPSPTPEPTAQTATAYEFAESFGQPSLKGAIDTPNKVAIAPNGDVYVTNAGRHQILKFNSDGVLQTKWGSEGSGKGQFSTPVGIAVDSAGDVYVADFGNHRIQKFKPNGGFLALWGETGASKGQGHFDGPWDVAVSSDDILYVTELNNNRVQSFSPDGQPLQIWGTLGSSNGQFITPQGIDVGHDGRLYVADTGNSRIQVFDSDGSWISAHGSYGREEGQFKFPTDVVVAPDGTRYVTERGNNRVQIFSEAPVAYAGELPGRFAKPMGLAMAPDGRIYVADTDNDRMRIFAGDALVDTWKSTRRGRFTELAPNALDVGPNGHVYVADWEAGEINVFAPDGGFVRLIERQLTAEVSNDEPWALTIDGNGNLYIADVENHRILKLDGEGRYIAQFGSFGIGEGEFRNPMGVAVDAEGNIYVADNVNRIQKFGPDFTFIAATGGVPEGSMATEERTGFAVHGDRLYIGNRFGDIDVFDTALNPLDSWRIASVPYSLNVDDDGYVFVGTGLGTVEKYSPEGDLVTTFGAKGSGEGQFQPVVGIPSMSLAVDRAGHVFISDTGNQRVQVFQPVE